MQYLKHEKELFIIFKTRVVNEFKRATLKYDA